MTTTSSIVPAILIQARRNFFALYEYFNGSLPQTLSFSPSLLNDEETVPISVKDLNELLGYLKETNEALQRKFPTEQSFACDNQYRFLRGLWAGHSIRTRDQPVIEDKFDSLNQVISMLKVRMRGLTETYHRQKDQIWDEQKEEEIFKTPQQHPIFQKMSSSLAQQQMALSEMTTKLSEIGYENEKLRKQNSELETKVINLKDKNKKSQKQMFELTKKKAKLEKKLYEIEVKGDKKLKNLIDDKENQENIDANKDFNLNISGVRFVEEQCCGLEEGQAKTIHTDRTFDSQGSQSNKLKQKFRHMKRTNRRTTAPLNSSSLINSSIDSIKNMKFERKSSKVLLVSQNEMEKSIRYSQIL